MFKMDDIPVSVEQFISLIKERPIIWDRTAEKYKNIDVTHNTWTEIMNEIYPDFDTWDRKNRVEHTQKAHKRWTNIRLTYLASMKRMQRREMYGEPIGKPYIYHKYLTFLDKIIPPPDTAPPTPTLPAQPTLECRIIKTETVEPYKNSDNGAISTETSNGFNSNIAIKIEQSANYEREIAILPSIEPSIEGRMTQAGQKNRHISFFNSLLPTLDKFDDDQVIEFQLGVMKLMKALKTKGPSRQHFTQD